MKEDNSSMSPQEFMLAIDELVKGMTQLHNRLLRIEKWMLRQEGLEKRRKQFLKTGERPK